MNTNVTMYSNNTLPNERTEVWTKVFADEDGLVPVGMNRRVTLNDLQDALAQSLGQDSVTPIFGGQFRFKIAIPAEKIIEQTVH